MTLKVIFKKIWRRLITMNAIVGAFARKVISMSWHQPVKKVTGVCFRISLNRSLFLNTTNSLNAQIEASGFLLAMQAQFIHSLKKQLLRVYNMPVTVVRIVEFCLP